MKEWDNRIKTILMGTSILLAGFLLFTKMVIPVAGKWKSQSQVIQKKKQQVQAYLKLIDQKEQLANKFDDLGKKIQAKLPVEREESQFLTEIGNVALGTNVHIHMMNPLPFRDIGAFKELSVEIDMEANVGNLVRFLYYMQKSSVVLVANRLILEPKAKNSALLKAHLVISTIFLRK